MGLNKYFCGHNPKNIGRTQSVGMPKNVQSGWDVFISSRVFYLKIVSKIVVSDLFHVYNL